eukprot:m.140167 g.140167  ORF g.140167 m.140167 type:complete len:403 (-) comp13178_c0_seq1:3100-4308(-)
MWLWVGGVRRVWCGCGSGSGSGFVVSNFAKLKFSQAFSTTDTSTPPNDKERVPKVGWLSDEGRQITDGQGQFGRFASQYDLYRPGYPQELFDRIFSFVTRTKLPNKPPPTLLHKDSKLSVADIGAGTGRGALAMSAMGLVDRIAVVEPDSSMLAVCKNRFKQRDEQHCHRQHQQQRQTQNHFLDGRTSWNSNNANDTDNNSTSLNNEAEDVVHNVEGSPHYCDVDVTFFNSPAEDTTIPTDTVDVAVCLQAWHWVDNTFGLIEMSRILELGGILAVVWNDRNLDDPLVCAMEDLIEEYNTDYNRNVRQCDHMEHLFNDSATFVLEHREDFHHKLSLRSAHDIVNLTNTFSYVKNVLSPPQLEEFSAKCLSATQRIASERASIIDDGVHIPYISRLYLLRRVR